MNDTSSEGDGFVGRRDPGGAGVPRPEGLHRQGLRADRRGRPSRRPAGGVRRDVVAGLPEMGQRPDRRRTQASHRRPLRRRRDRGSRARDRSPVRGRPRGRRRRRDRCRRARPAHPRHGVLHARVHLVRGRGDRQAPQAQAHLRRALRLGRGRRVGSAGMATPVRRGSAGSTAGSTTWCSRGTP